jgi:flagellin
MTIFNSINTNRQAVYALQSMNQTNSEMNVVQKRISTGYRVADAKDDSGAFSVAQSVRSDIAGVTAVNEQLGGTRGVLSTMLSSLTQISNTMQQLRTVTTRLADNAINSEARTQYANQWVSLVDQVRSFIQDATYNGRTLLSTAAGNLVGIRNETGATFSVADVDGATFIPKNFGMSGTVVAPAQWEAVQLLNQTVNVTTGSNLVSCEARINFAMSNFGSAAQFVDSQISFNSKRIDALTDGLGALVDADLAKESSRMKALEARQQLGIQTLSMANQGPASLLSLFR